MVGRPLNSNLILLIRKSFIEATLFLSNFKFQSDSINTVQLQAQLLLMVFFKFQSDSINTVMVSVSSTLVSPLNSNLILLIPVFKDTFKTTGYNTYFCRPQK